MNLLFLSSSVTEQGAVNTLAGGLNPSWGAYNGAQWECRASDQVQTVSLRVTGNAGRINWEHALVAHLVERFSCKEKAAGSKPVGGSV